MVETTRENKMKKKYKLKDYIEAIMMCWEYFLYILIIIGFIYAFFAYRYWLGGNNIKCMLAQDPAVCGAIINK